MRLKQSYLALAMLAGFGLALAGCSSSSDNGGTSLVDNLREILGIGADADVAAAVRALQAAEAAAEAAAAAAMAAQAAAEAAQATAEAERDAANEMAASAAGAQAMAEAERDAANAAAMAAAAAQAAAEAAQADAEAAQALAEAAQAAAVAAQAAAQEAAAAASQAQGMAEAERDAANMAAAEAQAAADAANATAAAANEAAAAATMRAETAEANAAQATADAMAATERAVAAEAAQAEAETAQANAEDARDAALALLDAGQAEAAAQVAAALEAQRDAENERDAAVMERDAALMAQGAAELARDNAQMALEAAQADDMADDEMIAMLTTERDNAQAALDTANADLATANSALETANADVTRLTMLLGSPDDAADADGSLYAQLAQAKADAAMYKQMVEEQEAERVHNERVARGNAISTALSTNRVGTANRSRTRSAVATEYLFQEDGTTPLAEGTSTRLPFGNDGVTAERDSGGTVTVKVALTDTADENKFADGTGTAGAQWTSAMLTRSMGEGTTASDEEIMVYTDIGAPTPTALAAEFATGETHVALDTTTDGVAARIKPDTVPAVGGPTLTHPQNGTFEGTYRGVDGTYTCTASGGCAVSNTQADGLGITGTLEFSPDNIAALWDNQDASYVYFGWWLNKPSVASNAHTTEAFSGQIGATAATVDTAMTGTAKYVGPAVGKYAVKSFTAGVQSDAEAGHFTATATLNADFHATDDGSISGTVDNFNTSGDANSSLWKVTLESTNFASGDATFDGNTQVTFGGLTVSGAGRWEGTFYDRDGTDPDDHPNTAIGTFDAHDPGGTANISGAFGTKRQ